MTGAGAGGCGRTREGGFAATSTRLDAKLVSRRWIDRQESLGGQSVHQNVCVNPCKSE